MATRYEHWDTKNAATSGAYTWAGQTFTPQANHTVRMVKTDTDPGGATHVVEIFATSGGLPTGSALASGVMSAVDHDPYEYVGLGAGVALSSGIEYAIRVVTGWPGANQVSFRVKTSDPRYSGGAFFFSSAIDSGVVFSTYDLKFEEWDASFPYPPTLTSPENGGNASITPTLQATYEHCESTAQAAAQWQIDTAGGDFSSPVWNSGEDAVNLLSVTIPSATLTILTEYDWRVRHKDSDSEWSEWSETWSFTTNIPAVTTQAVSNIATTTATGNGNITDLGSSSVTAHGVCYNTTGSPTISDSTTDEGAAAATGAYTTNMTGLTPGTKYYVKAYATNSDGTSYGSEVNFTAYKVPTVTTQAVTVIAATTATGNGNITDLGVPDPTAHGVCYNTTGSPTTADSTTDEGAAAATGAFTSSMTGLTESTKYYVKAYATNAAGTGYGDEVNFTSLTVTTQTCESVVGATATGRGNITALAGTVTAHGHCWDTSVDPTTSNSFVDNGAASTTGTFISAITGLTPGTAYYTRAYATNTQGTVYGANVYFVASTARAGYTWDESSNLRSFDENALERQYIHTDDVDDTPVNGATTDPVSSNWAFDHVAAADPHTGYVLESLFDAQTVLQATSDDTPVALTVTEQTVVGRLTGANITAVALGISDNNIAQIDHASVADDDYAKFTAAGLEGRSYQELVNDISGVIKATDVEVEELSTATYDDVQDYMNFYGDRTLFTGGAISDNGDGTATVSAGTGWCKETDSDTAVGKFFDFSADNSVSLTDQVTNYFYVDYNGGTPQIVVATSRLTFGFKQDHIPIGCSFRNGTTLHIHPFANLGIQSTNRTHMHHIEEADGHRASGIVATSTGTRNLAITAGVLYVGLDRHTTSPFTTPNSGTADATEANTLHDTDGGFASTDVGKTVHNTTDDTYADVTAFVDSGQLTLDGDIFISGENYDLDIFSYWYTSDSGSTWTEVKGSTAISNTQYNNIASGLANLTSNKYGIHWAYMDFDGGHLHIVYGQGDYTANQAETAGVPSTLPNLVTNYCVLIAKIICQEGTNTLTITYPWTTVFTSSLATDHGSLGGLGHNDHTQYFLLAGETTNAKLYSGADLLVYSDAGSTLKAQIDGATGHIGVGEAAHPDRGYNFYELFLIDDNDPKTAYYTTPQAYKTSAAYIGIFSGGHFQPSIVSANTQNWTNTIGLRGVTAIVQTLTGTAAEKTFTGAAGYYAEAAFTDGVNDIKITNYYGMYVAALSLVGNSKLTNDYGIYVGNQAGGATLNYAIYTNAGLVRFGDDLDFASGKGIGAFALGGKLTAGASEIEGTNFDIDGGDISSATISGDLTWSSAQTGVTLTSPTINGTIATTGLTLPAITMGGNIDMAINSINNMAIITFVDNGIIRTGANNGYDVEMYAYENGAYVKLLELKSNATAAYIQWYRDFNMNDTYGIKTGGGAGDYYHFSASSTEVCRIDFDTKNMLFATGKAIASGTTNGNTMLINANDTTFITLTTGATDVCTIANATMSGTWLASGTVVLPPFSVTGGFITCGDNQGFQTGANNAHDLEMKAYENGGYVTLMELKSSATSAYIQWYRDFNMAPTTSIQSGGDSGDYFWFGASTNEVMRIDKDTASLIFADTRGIYTQTAADDYLELVAYDSTGGTRTGMSAIRVQNNTAVPAKIGFFNTAPAAQQLKANHNNWAAVGDVVNALVNLGLFDQA